MTTSQQHQRNDPKTPFLALINILRREVNETKPSLKNEQSAELRETQTSQLSNLPSSVFEAQKHVAPPASSLEEAHDV